MPAVQHPWLLVAMTAPRTKRCCRLTWSTPCHPQSAADPCVYSASAVRHCAMAAAVAVTVASVCGCHKRLRLRDALSGYDMSEHLSRVKHSAYLCLCRALGTAAERKAPPAHLAGFTPAQFRAAADVVLQLRDGARLPAHSQLLASTSPILCDMLNLAVSQTPAGSRAEIPLQDFSEEEAVDVLKARTCW